MAGLSLLSLALPSPRLPHTRRAARGIVYSLLVHATAAAVIAVVSFAPMGRPSPSETPALPRTTPQAPRIVFLQMPGPGGGGGGGGNRQSAPPSRARAIGQDRLTVPVAPRIAASPTPRDASAPAQLVALHAVPLAAGDVVQAGMPEAASSLPFSYGPGTGGGVGDGSGTGIGPGTGPGLGEGSGGGFGGGAYRPGNGVSAPKLLKKVSPVYTPEAMQRKIQGTVVLEVIVGRDGLPSAIRVLRSLDAGGLDAEAVKAVRQWQFDPGRIADVPVDVLVVVLLDFHMY